MELETQNPALILIDVQKGWDDLSSTGVKRNNLYAENIMESLLKYWRDKKLPVIHVRHSSKNPKSKLYKSSPGFEIIDSLKPIEGELVITKNVNSAFIGTNLEKELIKNNIEEIVLIGVTTNYCVSTTARMAGNLGFRTFVVSNATYAIDRVGPNGIYYDAETMHNTTLANLEEEFAFILNSNQIINLIQFNPIINRN